MVWHCLIEIEPYDHAEENRVPVRLASANLRSITGLGGKVWNPALTEPPKTSIALFGGDFSDPVKAGTANFRVNMARARAGDPAIDGYFWPGAPVTIYVGREGDAWPWTTHFAGRVASFAFEKGALSLTCRVDEEPFAAEVLHLAYEGTGDAEGGDDLKDQPKPLVIGHARNVEPVLIDAVNSIYQFSGYGPIEAVDALFERASDFGSSVGDYEDYEALVEATVPRGRWATCLAEGMVKLGAPAYGVITGDVRGHAVDGETPQLTGEIILALADIAGVDLAKVDTATIEAMDVAKPYAANVVLTDRVRFIEIARRLGLPCNQQVGISLTGKLFATSVEVTGEGATDLHAQGRRDPQVTEVSELTVSAPYARVMLGANRSWRVHSADEIAFDAPLVPRGKYDPAETYRRGHIVTLADKSRWLYILDTPTSGNAPPTWPETSNTWWSNLEPPVGAADITYNDGTPIENLKPAEPDATKGAPEGTEVAGRPAEDLVGQVDEHEDAIGVLAAALGPLEDAANDLYGEVERLDGRIDEADGAISAVASDLETEAERLDGRIDEAGAAIAAARARLQTEAERLKAMIALAGVGVLAEVQTRADAVAAEVTRIDGILASLDDPDGGLDAAHALIATLETATVDLENPASLASQIEVLEAAIDTAEGSLSARVTTLETATASMAGDIADNAGAIADNAGDIVALAGRTDTIEAELDAQGEDIGEIQAAVTAVEQAAVTSRAAAAYAAERMAAQVGLSRVSVLAERRAAASETQAEASRIDAIEAEIDDPDDGLPAAHAAIASLETAVVDLEAGKAEASDVEALEVALTDVAEDIGDLDGRLTSAEGSIITHTSAIAGLVSDVSTLDGGLALLADEVSGIDGRLTTAEGTVTTLVSTATSLSARMTDAEADIASIAGAAVTSRAAAAYAAQRMAAQVGLSRVSVLAERRAAASETQAEASRIDAIEAEIDDPDDGLPAAHAAIASLETAVVDLEAGKAEASDLAALVAEIEDEETGLASKASVTALNSAVADLEGDISAVASSVSTVSAEVGDLSSEVTEVEEAVAGIGARWGVVINVNGRAAGMVRLDGTGQTSTLDVEADAFRIMKSGGGERFEFSDGNGRVYDSSGTLRVRWGVWS